MEVVRFLGILIDGHMNAFESPEHCVPEISGYKSFVKPAPTGTSWPGAHERLLQVKTGPYHLWPHPQVSAGIRASSGYKLPQIFCMPMIGMRAVWGSTAGGK